MIGETIESFLNEVKTSVQKHFADFQIEIILKTPKSLKAKIYLEHNLFVAMRYNARNKRMDFALIHNDHRVFGYDNLKEWHYHPFNSPSSHISCEKPPIEKIISEIKETCKILKKRESSK